MVSALIAGGMGPFLILAWTKVERVSMVFSPEKSPAPRVKEPRSDARHDFGEGGFEEGLALGAAKVEGRLVKGRIHLLEFGFDREVDEGEA